MWPRFVPRGSRGGGSGPSGAVSATQGCAGGVVLFVLFSFFSRCALFCWVFFFFFPPPFQEALHVVVFLAPFAARDLAERRSREVSKCQMGRIVLIPLRSRAEMLVLWSCPFPGAVRCCGGDVQQPPAVWVPLLQRWGLQNPAGCSCRFNTTCSSCGPV